MGAEAISVIGANPIDPRFPCAVVICLLDQNGDIVNDQVVMVSTEYARQVADQIIREADAADAHMRHHSTKGGN